MSNPHKGRTGLDRIIHAAGYSWAGLKAAYTGESAFRQETWLCIIATPLTYGLAQTWEQAVLLMGSLLLVLIVELLNSAVEAVVDRV
ncbi:diacylglycerol kinase, partial [Acinetobacter baumannii]